MWKLINFGNMLMMKDKHNIIIELEIRLIVIFQLQKYVKNCIKLKNLENFKMNLIFNNFIIYFYCN